MKFLPAYYGVFRVNEKEYAQADDWLFRHWEGRHVVQPKRPKTRQEKLKSRTSFPYRWEFLPDALCTGIQIRCLVCGDSADVTDLDSI